MAIFKTIITIWVLNTQRRNKLAYWGLAIEQNIDTSNLDVVPSFFEKALMSQNVLKLEMAFSLCCVSPLHEECLSMLVSVLGEFCNNIEPYFPCDASIETTNYSFSSNGKPWVPMVPLKLTKIIFIDKMVKFGECYIFW